MRGQAHSGVLEINGARLGYDEVGSGPPIVFLHAGVADRSMWDPQVAAFSDRFRCVRYDLRGFGASDLPAAPFSSRDDLAAVLDARGLARPVLVGCSMGGSVAFDFALERPEAIRALVLVGTGVSGATPPQELRDAVAASEALLERGEIEAAVDAVLRLWLDGPQRPAGTVRGALRERVRAMNLALARREVEWMRSHETFPAPRRLDPPAIGRLESMRAPTLVIVGSSDVPFVVETCGMVAARVPGAELVVIEDAAHLPSLERPERFNEVLEAFLART